MDALQTITPLIGVVMGGLLTGASALYKGRAERKRIIATALADLLEVRHRLSSIDNTIRAFRGRPELQPQLLPAVRDMLEQLIPIDPSLDERYDKAVTMLASIDPVSAFTLRSKNWIPRVFSDLRSQAAASGLDRAAFEVLEAELRLAVAPMLDAAVVELATAHSWFTMLKVRRLIKKWESAPASLFQLVERLQAMPLPAKGPDATQAAVADQASKLE